MHVGIDARPLATPHLTGVGNIIFNLVKRLLACNVSVTLFYDREPEKRWFESPLLKEVILSHRRRMLWEQVLLPLAVKRSGIEIYHATWNSGLPLFSSIPSVLTIHDLIPLLWDDYFSGLRSKLISRPLYLLSMEMSIQRATVILADSQASRHDVIKHFGVGESKIKVIYSGVDPCFADMDLLEKYKAEHGIRRRYLMYVGGLDRRKNIGSLFYAFSRLRNRDEFQLVIVGEKNAYFPTLKAYANSFGIGLHVIFPGYLPARALHTLLAGSEALMYPSLYEGFGIPPLEAMQCGCPVIASRISPLVEVCGDAALLVNPYERNELVLALERLLSNHELRLELVRKGLERAKPFSWERMFRGVLETYQEVSRRRGNIFHKTANSNGGSL